MRQFLSRALRLGQAMGPHEIYIQSMCNGGGGVQKSYNRKLPELISLFFLNAYFILCGAAIKRITYSKVNQPTNTASATSKKYSSSETKRWKVRKLKKIFHLLVLTSQYIFQHPPQKRNSNKKHKSGFLRIVYFIFLEY